MANFKNLLNEWIDTAEQSLILNRNNYLEKYENIYFSNLWIDSKLNRIKEINLMIEKLKYEKSKIEWEIKDLNPRLWSEKFNEILEMWYTGCSRNTNESDYFVFMNTKDSIVVKNVQNFSAIRKRFTQSMNFAISPKEQRLVLSEFSNLDWNSLWIDIPIDVRFDKITIEDWEIKVTQKLLSN